MNPADGNFGMDHPVSRQSARVGFTSDRVIYICRIVVFNHRGSADSEQATIGDWFEHIDVLTIR